MSARIMKWPTTISEASAKFRDGSLGIETLTRHFLDGIKARQPMLNAFITVTENLALESAAALAAELKTGADRGPLHGIPVVIKDDTDVVGFPTTVGSALYRERIPHEDAAVVKRLKAAGAVILGKTNMNEFAAGGKGGFNPHFGDTHNPWSLDHEPGGSSSGTAVAVAALLCLGGTGTDAGGSVRGPAARCGVVGVRPTFGLVSTTGVYPRCRSFEAVGPIARTVADAAVLLNILTGYDPDDQDSLDVPDEDYTRDLGKGVRNLRLGVISDFSLKDLDEETLDGMMGAVDVFASLGAEIKDIDAPILSDTLDPAKLANIIFYEFGQVLRPAYEKTDTALFGEIVHADMKKAAKISRHSYEKVLAQRKAQSKEIGMQFEEIDALLTPTFPRMHMTVSQPPDLSGDHRRFSIPVSYFGLPSVSVPCGFSVNGLPIGMQIIGNRLQEGLILRIAATFESATDFQDRRPPAVWS